MLLLIDIGNTNTTIGFHDGGGIQDTLRLETAAGAFIDGIGRFILENDMEKPGGASLCSVVPEKTSLLTTALKKTFGFDPVVVSHQLKTGLTFSIETVEELGADRIANAVAAHGRYPGDLVVVDAGTATTFCVITENGEYLGGAIMPGPGVSVDALFHNTARLPRIELKMLNHVVGKNTDENIRTGIILGHAGAVERITREMEKELDKKLSVVMTGGYAGLLGPYIKADYINPDLTLEGLKIIYDLNS